MTKILDSIWFTPLTGGCIGIVKIKPEHGDVKYYIGCGRGINQKEDAQLIAQFGMPFSLPPNFIEESKHD